MAPSLPTVPPPLAPPRLPPGVASPSLPLIVGSASNVEAQSPSMLGDYEIELAAIVFGSVTATILLLLGANARRLQISRSAFLCVLIGSLDFASDVLFARHALLSSPDSVPATLRYLPIVFVAAPFVLSTAPLLMIVMQSRELIDMDTLARYPGFYACTLVLALTNLEVLKLFPWREGKYDGFPTSRLLALTFFTTAFEDIPQAVLQVSYLIAMGRGDAIAIISLCFSLCSIWVRGFRKLIIVLFVRPDHQKDFNRRASFSRRSSSFLVKGTSFRRRRSSAYPPAPGVGHTGHLTPGSGARLTERSASMPISSARHVAPARLRTNTGAVASPVVPSLATPVRTRAGSKGGATVPPAVYFGWCARRLGRFSFAGRRGQAQPIKVTPSNGSAVQSPGDSSRRNSFGSDTPCLSEVSSRRRSLSSAFDEEGVPPSWEEQPPITISSPRGASSVHRSSLRAGAVCDSPRASAADGTAVAAVPCNLDDVQLRLGEATFARLEAQLDPTMRAELRRRDSAASFLAASVAARAAATPAGRPRGLSAPLPRGASFGLQRGGCSLSMQRRPAQGRRGSPVGSVFEPTAAPATAVGVAAEESGKTYAESLRTDPCIMPLADLCRASSGGDGSGRVSLSSLNKRVRRGSSSDVLSELSGLLSDDDGNDAECEAAERTAVIVAMAAGPPIELGDVQHVVL